MLSPYFLARGFFGGIVGLVLIAGLLHADDATKTPAPEDKKKEAEKPQVTGVVRGSVLVGSVLVVKVERLPTDRAAAAWRLYLNGVLMKGIIPENGDVHQSNELRFRLDRTADSKQAWSTLLRDHGMYRDVRVGLGSEEGIDARVEQFTVKEMEVISFRRVVAILVAIAAILGILVYAGWKTPLLRSRAIGSPVGQLPPFSLGLTQMAFWFILILGSYLYIRAVTGEVSDSIPPSLLVLMGISTATAFGAVEIDADKRSRRVGLEAEKARLSGENTSLGVREAAATTAAEKAPIQMAIQINTTRLAEIESTLKTLPELTVAASQRFFYDLVSDSNGISLHRLQLVLWTLVFGLVFISEVYEKLTMPVFNETILTLIGISSGSYIGFKFPEKKA